MKAAHLFRGERAETCARNWLEAQGLCFLQANFRCRFGELDLLMLDADCLVVIEVRYRRSATHGGALGSVTRAKCERIIRAAQCFLQRHSRFRDNPLRFDVLAISGHGREARFDWRKQAFTLDG